MPELKARDAKLIQYLNEAYGKERELETALQAHIGLTTRDAYRKRLKDHLKETKQQATGLKRRIKELGGKAEAVPAPGPDVVAEAASAVQSAASKAVAAAKGPLHAIRGTSEPETMLKNAKTEFFNEHEEIANYNAIETLAEAVGDKETAKLAREYRRQEERMAKFLDRTIVQLTKEVVRTEIPAAERNGGRRRRSSGRRRRSTSAASSRRKSSSGARRKTASRKRS
jgi:ferritin-like metal-binding protein YciE